jgi:hypothetical protein
MVDGFVHVRSLLFKLYFCRPTTSQVLPMRIQKSEVFSCPNPWLVCRIRSTSYFQQLLAADADTFVLATGYPLSSPRASSSFPVHAQFIDDHVVVVCEEPIVTFRAPRVARVVVSNSDVRRREREYVDLCMGKSMDYAHPNVASTGWATVVEVRKKYASAVRCEVC